jgi:outer membrane lipoprotein-sorting protein
LEKEMKKLFLFILLGSLVSCAPKPTFQKAPLPSYKEAGLDQLISEINGKNRGINSLISSLRIEFQSPGQTKFLGCSAKMFLVKPDKIRLKGYRHLLPTFFLLVSNGERYWFFVPSQKKVYAGSADSGSSLTVLPSEDNAQEIVSLKPRAIIDALLLDEIKLTENEYAFFDILPDSYIISIVRKEGEGFRSLRRIWVERKELRVEHHQLFDEEGRLVSEVYFRNYVDFNGVSLPRLVFIKRPFERVNLRLTFSDVRINEDISADAFSYQVPPGMEVVREKKEEKDEA